MKSISEKILLYRIQVHHDPEAFGKLYDAYVNQIYRFVYFKVAGHEEAEDITADVFLKVWNYLQVERDIKSFSGLLYRVARNCIIDSYRAKGARQEVALDEFLEISDGRKGQDKMMSGAEQDKTILALSRLKQEYREIVTLRYVDELEISEIAELTEKSSVTVRVTLHRALKKLKEVMEVERKD